jgi:hypothetical protein
VAIAALSAAPVHAQRDKYAPIVLQIPAGARLTGLGGAFVAVRDIESVFGNPALVGTATGTVTSFERYRGSTAGTLAASMTLGVMGAAISTQVLDFRTVAIDFADPPPSRRPPPVSSDVLREPGEMAGGSLAGTFALATAWRGYRWGGAVKYVEERVGTWRGDSPAFDFGVAKEGGRIVTGLSVQNVGRSMQSPIIGPGRQPQFLRIDLPLRATLGAAGFGLPVGPFDFGASLALSVLRDGFVAPAAGMEWGYAPLEGYNFVVRAGVRRPELDQQRPITLGASASLDRFSLDYAFEDVRGRAGHRIGLRVR